jgi:hypothetical protein
MWPDLVRFQRGIHKCLCLRVERWSRLDCRILVAISSRAEFRRIFPKKRAELELRLLRILVLNLRRFERGLCRSGCRLFRVVWFRRVL